MRKSQKQKQKSVTKEAPAAVGKKIANKKTMSKDLLDVNINRLSDSFDSNSDSLSSPPAKPAGAAGAGAGEDADFDQGVINIQIHKNED